jgi:hypothetical protein
VVGDNANPISDPDHVVNYGHVEDLLSPDYHLTLRKTEPVTFPGFVPVRFSNDASEPRSGENVTVVVYGANYTWDYGYRVAELLLNVTFPGRALERSLQVLDFGYCDPSHPAYRNESYEFCAAERTADFPHSFWARDWCDGSCHSITAHLFAFDCRNFAHNSLFVFEGR